MVCMARLTLILRYSAPSNRQSLTAFLCLFRWIIGLTTGHVDNKGIIDGLRRGEVKCTGPQANDADLWIINLGGCAQITAGRNFCWKSSISRRTSLKEGEAGNVEFRKFFVAEGNERADEVAKDGTMLD